MFSFERLEQAAASFGMKASREVEGQRAKTSLKVRLFKGVDVEFSDEGGRRSERLLYGGFPYWVPQAAIGLLLGAGGAYLVSHSPLEPVMYEVFLALLVTGLVSSFTRDRACRARDRLNDRAYLLSSSAPPQDGRRAQGPPQTPPGEGERLPRATSQATEGESRGWDVSLASLELAADSLGWATSRPTNALTVHPHRGFDLSFAEERGKMTWQRGDRVPEGLVVAMILFVMVVGFTTKGRAMFLNGAMVAVLLSGRFYARRIADRAVERLYDRAYALQHARLKTA